MAMLRAKMGPCSRSQLLAGSSSSSSLRASGLPQSPKKKRGDNTPRAQGQDYTVSSCGMNVGRNPPATPAAPAAAAAAAVAAVSGATRDPTGAGSPVVGDGIPSSTAGGGKWPPTRCPVSKLAPILDSLAPVKSSADPGSAASTAPPTPVALSEQQLKLHARQQRFWAFHSRRRINASALPTISADDGDEEEESTTMAVATGGNNGGEEGSKGGRRRWKDVVPPSKHKLSAEGRAHIALREARIARELLADELADRSAEKEIDSEERAYREGFWHGRRCFFGFGVAGLAVGLAVGASLWARRR